MLRHDLRLIPVGQPVQGGIIFRRLNLPAQSQAAFVALGAQVLQIVLGLLSTPVLLSTLGKARFSQLAVLWALIFFAPLLDAGLPRVVARAAAHLLDAQRGASALKTLRSALLVQTGIVFAGFVLVVLGLALVGAGGNLRGFDIGGEYCRALMAFAGVLAGLLFQNLFAAHLQGRGWLHRMTAVQAVAGILTAATPLTIWFFPLDIGDVAVGFLIVRGLALTAGILTVCLAENVKPLDLIVGPRQPLKPLLREGAHGIAYFALAPLVVYGERYVMPAVSGVHSISQHLIAIDVGLRMLVVPGVVSQYAFRSVAQGYAGGLREVLRHYITLLAALFIIPISAAILFGPELIGAWLGVQSEPLTVLCVRLVCVSISACTLAALLIQICIATAHTAALSKYAVVEVLVYLSAAAAAASMTRDPATLALTATSLWTLRLATNSIAIVRLARPAAKVSGLWRLLCATALPACAALAAALLIEASCTGITAATAKVSCVGLLCVGWWQWVRPWAINGVRPL